ncbi:MAG: HAMP domain-containing histidine kinase [Aeromicrobium sp.]|nr:HAMP domain-containing histidine kinase [Burkholderiales bacterium]
MQFKDLSMRIDCQNFKMPISPVKGQSSDHEEVLSQAALIKLLREANQNLLLATLKAQDLQAQAEAAKQKQDEFLAMMAHELRNPLSPIVTATEILRLAVGADPKLSKIQKTISRQANALHHLVDQLLDASRITTGKMRIDRQQVRLGEIIESAIEICKPVIDMHHHVLTIVCLDNDIEVDVDALRLTQVFSNLLINAAKFTPPNGQITLTASCTADQVHVSVKDNGMGISSEMQSEIFEIFTQGPQGLDRKNGGLGIGLSLVRSVVEAHGGTVSVVSAGENAGTEFTVIFPMRAIGC